MFGYKLVPTGTISKKGRAINELCIDQKESELVRSLFRMTAEEGKGTTQLANYLNELKVRTHKNAEFQANNIMRILRNRIYIGYMDTKKIKGPYREDLRIVDDETFCKVQDILEQRKAGNEEKRKMCLSTKSTSLYSGILFCGHCGGRITVSASSCYYTAKNEKKQRYCTHNYVCANRANRRCDCDGQASYNRNAVDNALDEIVGKILENISDTPQSAVIAKTYQARITELAKQVKELKYELEKLHTRQKALIIEIPNSLTDEGKFPVEYLKESLRLIEEEIKNTDEKLSECSKRLENAGAEKKAVEKGYSQLTTWANEYLLADFDRKRMIISEIFDRIEIKRGYEISVTINEIYKPFLTGK
ncbi:MAG: recombinase family protein [Ruminiclostridium sp.]